MVNNYIKYFVKCLFNSAVVFLIINFVRIISGSNPFVMKYENSFVFPLSTISVLYGILFSSVNIFHEAYAKRYTLAFTKLSFLLVVCITLTVYASTMMKQNRNRAMKLANLFVAGDVNQGDVIYEENLYLPANNGIHKANAVKLVSSVSYYQKYFFHVYANGASYKMDIYTGGERPRYFIHK